MQNIKGIIGAMLLALGVLTASSQEEMALYNEEVPNSKAFSMDYVQTTDDNGITRVTGVTNPTLTAYFPPEGVTNTGKAVIICPGGGYAILAISHEGHDVAKLLAANGISAFVLKYRLPKEEIMIDKRIGPLQDAQRAIQLVRERAPEWGITENQIGIAGFSAGGHLAATLSTHYQDAVIANPQRTSLRPDFSLLVYPVISMQAQLTHGGSRKNLLGNEPSEKDVTLFSNELQVTADTPPAFLVHAEDDTAVPIANSEAYVAALRKHGVTTKLITYPEGGHGFGLNNKTTADKWFDHFLGWLADH
ncbi:alpha/beta hydrolase [Parapedobacter sp. 10938]|uniref:alpha/beta hydrolase n=1 Tax=Parapedobacter flavus TaxID=3110225 RepID=UPI002DC05368|nr:alpha/beta hydrolase [Parapedobacter sp. 10938]MEC3879240.1 alpha/beta hydrolase [Parapedobacter sp. 10938]